MAMHKAVKQLKNIPDLLLVDGNRFKTCIYTKENGDSQNIKKSNISSAKY